MINKNYRLKLPPVDKGKANRSRKRTGLIDPDLNFF